MKDSLTMLLIAPFMILFMFQPFLNEVYSLRQMAVEIVLDREIEKASVNGCFSQADIDEMKTILKDTFHYTDSEIVFIGTQVIKPRKQYIEGTLGVPSGQIWLFPNLFNTGQPDPDMIWAYATQMSEYIPR